MIKVLIVEDEPLVQIGIRSMIPWSSLGYELCPIAKDGIQGLQYIEAFKPSIVLTDIKMPRMDGLMLMKEAREKFGKIPVFIILTSYEEFKYLKEAMKYDVVEYLIKLELNDSDLKKALTKGVHALDIVIRDSLSRSEAEKQEFITERLNIVDLDNLTTNTRYNLGAQSFYDKYFIKLLYNLFDCEKQQQLQASELKLELKGYAYILSYHEMIEYSPMWQNSDINRLLSLYSSSIQMIRELIRKYNNAYVVTLDTKHFVILYSLDNEQSPAYKAYIMGILKNTITMIHNYFNVTILTTISNPYTNLSLTVEAFQDVRQIFSFTTKEKPILFYADIDTQTSPTSIFNMSLFREEIKSAFEEFNTDVLYKIITEISNIFSLNQTRYLKSIDAASNLIYLAISLLPNGEETVNEIFKDEVDGYRSLYKYSTVEQVTNYLFRFRDGLCRILKEQKKNYKNHIVYNVKKYIDEHLTEKLSLQDVANIFGLSPNYLSQLFKKYNDIGFNDYITICKINKAKDLMVDGRLKLYEIAEQLGFENSFYFSKVFKKVEGLSPRDYLKQRYGK